MLNDNLLVYFLLSFEYCTLGWTTADSDLMQNTFPIANMDHNGADQKSQYYQNLHIRLSLVVQ